jgi:hypothetical protein
MSETSARFALPFILPGQAQKEVFHNEALTRIDAVLHAAIEGDANTPPVGGPEAGRSCLVAAGAMGAWGGQENHLASWTSGGWRFCAPVAGMLVWDKSLDAWRFWNGTAWSAGELPAAKLTIEGLQVVGPRRPAVPSPSGGTIIDTEARAAVNSIIATLMSHGLID